MATNDTRRQFDEIVAGLTADYPSLARRRPRPRWLVVTAAIAGGVVWALLSVAMVAWGAIAVATSCVVVATTVAGILIDSYRWRPSPTSWARTARRRDRAAPENRRNR